MSHQLYNALIRTHHITSRKKVAKLKASASSCHVYALLRSGGCPGIMYCQGSESGVKEWVSNVQRLRYKDFRLVRKPAEMEFSGTEVENGVAYGKLEEVDAVKDFGERMERIGIWRWWRKGMGYVGND